MNTEQNNGFDSLSDAGSGYRFVDGEVVLIEETEKTTEEKTDEVPNLEDNKAVPPVEEKTETTEETTTETTEATTEETTTETTEEVVNPLDELFKVDVLPEDQAKAVEWNKLASELGFENADSIKTKEELQVSIRAEIEKHKQIVEPDLSKYGEEAKDIISKLEQGIELRDVLNPIRHLDAFVLSSDEYKVSFMLRQEGLDDEQINERVEELRENGKLSQLAMQHTQLAENLIAQELQAIEIKTTERNQQRIQAQQDKLNSEIAQLEETVKSLKDYKGVEIPDNYKQYVLSQIKTGQFQSKLHNAQAQVNAFLDLELGAKIAKLNVDKLTEAERAAFNKARLIETEARHNIPPQPKAGVKAPPVEEKNKQRFDGWSVFE